MRYFISTPDCQLLDDHLDTHKVRNLSFRRRANDSAPFYLSLADIYYFIYKVADDLSLIRYGFVGSMDILKNQFPIYRG